MLRGESITYPHPALEEVLKSTYGVTIYQEQVMKIANVIAGMNMAEADNLRRAMSKKMAEKMAKMKDVFIRGAGEKGISKRKALAIWDSSGSSRSTASTNPTRSAMPSLHTERPI